MVNTADIKDIDIDLDEEKIITKEKFVPPSLDEIKKYIAEKNLNIDGEKFYNYFTEGNWIDSKGNKVKNWKQKILTWNGFRTKVKDTTQKKDSFNDYEQRQDVDFNKFYVNGR